MNNKIKEIVSNLPSTPGIYLMKGRDGEPIYIGKAKSLRQRVSSYFQESPSHSFRTAVMVGQVEDIDFILTENEVSALILESNFIKKYQPRYNVLLKDDKHYPYIRLTTNEPFPRLEVARKVKKNGGTYFGPYAKAKEVRQTLRLIQTIFPLRQSRDALNGSPKRRPCLNFQMGRCLGPCSGRVSQEEYGKMVSEAILFLKGRNRDLLKLLKAKMQAASSSLDFEKAAMVRDQIKAVRNVVDRRAYVSASIGDIDILGLFSKDKTARLQLLSVRGGKLMAQRGYSMNHLGIASGPEILASFIKQYYNHALFIPSEIIMGEEPPDKPLIEEWLSLKKGKRVRATTPKKGEKRALARMAEESAASSFFKAVNHEKRKKDTLLELQSAFALKSFPRQIDAVDISNTFGASPVGGLVVFVNGEPDKSKYRRFAIKRVEGIDDYAMIRELLYRHYSKILKEGRGLPDLLLIDGGKGHLNCALDTLKGIGLTGLELLSVAKGKARGRGETDKIFRPGETDPVSIHRTHPARRLLISIRDEVHRFSITAHRQQRGKKAKSSVLEGVKGIGPKRRLTLMKQFKGPDRLNQAGVEEIAALPGMTLPLARAVKDALLKK